MVEGEWLMMYGVGAERRFVIQELLVRILFTTEMIQRDGRLRTQFRGDLRSTFLIRKRCNLAFSLAGVQQSRAHGHPEHSD